MTREEAVALLERYSNYDGMGIPNLAGCKEAMRVAVDALKEAFPELAESGDERIRKWIANYIHMGVFREKDHPMALKAIEWLEKQKYDRMQPIYDNLDSFESALAKAWKEYHDNGQITVDGLEDNYMECAHAKGFREGYLFGLEKQKEKKQSLSEKFRPDFPAVADFIESVDNMERNRAIGILEDYLKWAVSSEEECRYTWKELADAIQLGIDAMKEQKPAEYLDKDRIYAIMKKLHNLSFSQDILINSKEYKQIDEITHDVRDLLDYPIEQKQEWSEDIILKAVKEIGLTQYQINWFKSNVFPPKPEWSQEDNKNLGEILGVIYGASCGIYRPFDRDTYKRWESWLKSLRPLPHWKPTEEQMEALNVLNLHGDLSYVGQQNQLISLYQDLKKL